MATTMFFEECIHDAARPDHAIDLEFGRTSYHNRENLIYIKINGEGFILNKEMGKKLVQEIEDLGSYLGY